MNIDILERVRVAYKKLKQMVHFDKSPLVLRRLLADFEYSESFEKKLQIVAKVAGAEVPHETIEFKEWLNTIDYHVIPKGVEGANKLKDWQGAFVSNVTSAPVHRVRKVNYIFNGPVELHLLAVLWLMIEGWKYDDMLSSHCSGSRLHEFVGEESDHSAYLFKKYHELYANWRDSGIQKARDLLSDDKQSVCVVGLDVQEYYYRINLDWESLRKEIHRPTSEGIRSAYTLRVQTLGSNLFKCIEEICKNYREKLSAVLAVTHPELDNAATCLPIGLCTSPVIANWYLKVFDDEIFENVRPAYYGRYVDDILMVVTMSNPPNENDPIMNFIDRVLVRAEVLKWDRTHDGFEICSRPGLFLQKNKCILQYFDSGHSIAGLDKFQKQIEENASDFALLPVDGDDSPVAQVAYDLLYDGSVNKFRSIKAVTENRWELAGHLAKQTQLHLMTEGSIDKNLRTELFRFFKGRNAIDYWDMWERVIVFLLIAGDRKGADDFSKEAKKEIKKTSFSLSEKVNRNITNLLRQALEKHLELCMEMSLAITSTVGQDSDDTVRVWRESNLIRHHFVAIPLLNYTNFAGNLAAPLNPKKLIIDENKAVNSPRFVHFDECLGFVDSGCAAGATRNSIARANEIYKKFHGCDFMDVRCNVIGKEVAK